MRFTVAAFAPIPDTDTARIDLDLHDLDDKSVSKVLFHRRKQQTGNSEKLRWDQLQTAGITLIRHSIEYVEMISATTATGSESDMLRNLFKAVSRDNRLVYWDDDGDYLPFVRFRAVKLELNDPAYWRLTRENSALHLDLANWFQPDAADRPTIDELSRRFLFPGMLGQSLTSVWTAALSDDVLGIQAYSDLKALNTYLLALQVLSTSGEMTLNDAARARLKLREVVNTREEPYLKAFLQRWKTV